MRIRLSNRQIVLYAVVEGVTRELVRMVVLDFMQFRAKMARERAMYSAMDKMAEEATKEQKSHAREE
jgi:hypothetical protein